MLELGASLIGFATDYGYLGALLISLLGSIVPFVPIPYLVVVMVMGHVLNPLQLGIAAGFGAATGKLTSYLLGRGGYLLTAAEERNNLDILRGSMGRYNDLGVFVFAVTPLPDDLFFVPMGMIRFPLWRFFLANAAGKVLLSASAAYFGSAFLSAARLAGQDDATSILILVASTLLLTALLYRIDWREVIEIRRRSGMGGIIRNLPKILRARTRTAG